MIKNYNYSRFWKGFWQLADPKIWIASTIPIAVGTALAFNMTGKFSIYWLLWTLIGIYSIEIGKNAINEVIDYQTGVDRFVDNKHRTPFSGGKKTIVDNKLSINEVKLIAIFTMLAGGFIGIYIALYHEPQIFKVGIPGFILAILYSLPPFKLAYRGLGEITVGITFGPLISTGAYMVQASSFSWIVILVSLPIGFLISNILWINQYPDYEADKKGNKNNWVVRLGKKEGIKVYISLFAGCYISLALILVVFSSIIWLLPFITLPLAIKAIKVARNNYNNIPKLISANIKTVQVYQLLGLTLVIASLLDKLLTN